MDPAHKQALICAGKDFYAAGDYTRASHMFYRMSDTDIARHSKQPNFIETLVYCHFMAGRQSEAQDILSRYKGKKAAVKTNSKSKESRGSSKKGQKAGHHPRNLNGLKVAICAANVEKIQATLSQIKRGAHATLVDIEKQMVMHKEQAEALLAQLRAQASPELPTVRNTLPSDQNQTPSPFTEIQRLAQEVESLNQRYKKEKAGIDHLAFKDYRKRVIAHATEEESVAFFPTQVFANTKDLAPKREKKKTRGKASPANKGASHASSASVHTVNLSNVEWRLTPTAQKHLSDLHSVPGFQGKFEAFRQEIEMEPWGRRGNALTHASGRAKLLKGYDNVFSRRFSKGDRFFYRVERQEDGRVVVTILGLMGHDL